MIDWNDYYYFALIADEGSYSQAALRAGVSKSVLSRRMAALEERLGVRLIQRTTRRLALTAAGAAGRPVGGSAPVWQAVVPRCASHG